MPQILGSLYDDRTTGICPTRKQHVQCVGGTEGQEDVNTVNNATTVMQTAALNIGSTLKNTYSGTVTIPLEITTAINQLHGGQDDSILSAIQAK
jgi:hypothetical protein